MDFHDLRQDYRNQPLDRASVHSDPIQQFAAWFQQAVQSGLREPNAMNLATATPDGNPSVRVVLLKEFNSSGFVFFTNYESRKALELSANPRAELLFYWGELERQVRIHGPVAKVSAEESDSYFATRPVEARIGAHASLQSSVIESRQSLESRFAELRARFEGVEVPRPRLWGGYRVTPESFEFWQGRPSRLHDRILYQRMSPEGWSIVRLSP